MSRCEVRAQVSLATPKRDDSPLGGGEVLHALQGYERTNAVSDAMKERGLRSFIASVVARAELAERAAL
jgi:hypothetical protein